MIEEKSILQLKNFSNAKRKHVLEIANSLAKIPWVEAIALGGSYGRDTAKKNSDIDLELFYFDSHPPLLQQLEDVAKKFDSNAAVINFNEWNILNKAIVITTKITVCELFCQNLDHLTNRINHAKQGFFDLGFNTKDTMLNGFSNVRYLSWPYYNKIIYDPKKVIARLKKEVQQYPCFLQNAVVLQCLDKIAIFLFPRVKVLAYNNRIYAAVGYMRRIIIGLMHVLFALNQTYYFADKGAMKMIESFSLKPKDYVKRVNNLLAYPGQGKALKNSVEKLGELIHEIVELSTKTMSITPLTT